MNPVSMAMKVEKLKSKLSTPNDPDGGDKIQWYLLNEMMSMNQKLSWMLGAISVGSAILLAVAFRIYGG